MDKILELQRFAIAWSDGDAGTPTVNPINVTTQANMSASIFDIPKF